MNNERWKEENTMLFHQVFLEDGRPALFKVEGLWKEEEEMKREVGHNLNFIDFCKYVNTEDTDL